MVVRASHWPSLRICLPTVNAGECTALSRGAYQTVADVERDVSGAGKPMPNAVRTIWRYGVVRLCQWTEVTGNTDCWGYFRTHISAYMTSAC